MTGEERSTETLASRPPEKSNPQPAGPRDFRWQSLFQRSKEPVFLLNRQRRILFVNEAWEKLTGITGVEARGLICVRRAAAPGDPWDLVVRILCCPPPETLRGEPARARRLVPSPGTGAPRLEPHGADTPRLAKWWRVDFLPLQDEQGLLCILGKIIADLRDEPFSGPPIPDKLIVLRETRCRCYRIEQVVSQLPPFHRVLAQARLASATTVPLLIEGEPGVGKEWLARTIHYESASRDRPFIALDCHRLSITAIERAIFSDSPQGREPGGDTLYLREPALLPRDFQMRLCQQILAGEESAGRRIMAGSTIDSSEAIRDGRLLAEFHSVLSPLAISLPPLRERLIDLPDLVERMLERMRPLLERPITGLTAEAWDLVRAYSWPGNLRELFITLRGACLRATGEILHADYFPSGLRLAVRMDRSANAEVPRPISLDQVLEQAERRLILLALKKAAGNKSRAAEFLSIWRPRLLRRMEALGINEAAAD
jgi:hypothetical protein